MLKLLGRLLYEAFTDEVPQSRKKTTPPHRSTRSRSTPRKTSSPKSPSQKTSTRSERIYGTETIRPRTLPAAAPVPAMIFQMRSIAPYDAQRRPRTLAQMFFVQARFMEHFSDDYPETVPCTRTVPTYTVMKDNELRAYFTWRTRYRAGLNPAPQPGFLLLHAFELLNCIGAFDPADALAKLCALLDAYGENAGFRRQILQWIPDFAACHGLAAPVRDPKESACLTILRHSAHADSDLLSSLDLLANYKLAKSKSTLDDPEQTAAALHAVYRALLQHYAEDKLQSFAAHLLGGSRRAAHILFDGAVVDTGSLPQDGEFRLSPLCVYRACGGTWAAERFCSDPDAARIGAYLRSFDSILREETGFRNKLKPGEIPADDAAVIRQAIRDFLQEKQRARQQKQAEAVTLNADELAAIRAAADRTAEMLTLPEEEVEVLIPQEEPAAPQDSALAELPVQQYGISAPAAAMLLCLLTGQSLQPLRDEGQMLSILAEEVNEKLYDRFGDIVLETDGDTPILIEDYTEELRQLFEAQ